MAVTLLGGIHCEGNQANGNEMERGMRQGKIVDEEGNGKAKRREK